MQRFILGLVVATGFFAGFASSAKAQYDPPRGVVPDANESLVNFTNSVNACQNALNIIAAKGHAGNANYEQIWTVQYYLENAAYYMSSASAAANRGHFGAAANDASIALQYWSLASPLLQESIETNSGGILDSLNTAYSDAGTAQLYAWYVMNEE